MSSFVKFEKPYAIRDAGGNLVYESASFPYGIEDVLNSEATATIGRGEAVKLDGTASVFPRWDYAAAGTDTLPQCKMAGKRVAAASDVVWIGVAMGNIVAGAVGQVLTLGYAAVKSLTAASLTSNTAGAIIIGSSTAGSVNATNVAIVQATLGTSLGMVAVPAGTSAGQSGSLTQLIARLAAGY